MYRVSLFLMYRVNSQAGKSYPQAGGVLADDFTVADCCV